MNVLHMLVSGGTGGIEILMKNYARQSAHNNIFVFVWKSGEVAREMERCGVPVRVTNAGEEGLLTTLKRIRRICLEEQVDVVVSHNSAPLLKLALLYIKFTLPGVKTVAYAHANARDICESSRKKGLLLRKTVHRLGFAGADGIIAISESVRTSLQTVFGVKKERVTKIYNGTPIAAQKAHPGHPKDKGCLNLMYVGRLIPEKGVQNTLYMLAELRKTVPATLTVVGDGPYRDSLEALTNTLGLEDRVRFLGQRSDVSDLLAQADIFVHLPDWAEGFGITVIEAMAAGLPCVVNDRGALPEIVEDGISGRVVKAGDSEGLQKTLKVLWDAPGGEWHRLRTGALHRAEAFSLESFVQKLDGLLTEVRGMTE